MDHAGGFVEEDERAPRFLLSMRVKYAVGCACLFLAVSLMALAGLPHFVQALHGLGQGEAPDDMGNMTGNVSGPELVWKLYEPQPHIDDWEECYGIAVVGGDSGCYVVVQRVSEFYRLDHLENSCRDVVLYRIDSEGGKVWEVVFGDEGTSDNSFGSIAATDDGGAILSIHTELCVDPWHTTSQLLRVDSSGDVVWEKTLSESNWGNWEVYAIIQCSDGGAAAVWKNGPICLLRMDAYGDELWEKNLDIPGGPYGKYDLQGSLVESRDGGFIAAFSNGYFVKLDASGNKVWERTYGNESIDTSPRAISTVGARDGGVVVTGSTGVYKIGDDGNKVWEKTRDLKCGSVIARVEDGYIIAGTGSDSCFPVSDPGRPGTKFKIDDDGNVVWEKEYEERYAACGMVEVDGGLVLVNHVTGSPHVWRIDDSGELVWDRFYGDTKKVNDIALSEDEGCVVAGWTRSFGALAQDAYLYRIDGDGRKVWERSYGGAGWDSADCIVGTGDGGFVAAGYSSSFGRGDRDVYIVRVDGEGNKIWENTYGTPQQDMTTGIIPSGDGGYVVLGNTESDEYDTYFGYAYVLKINAAGEKVWDRNYDQFSLYNSGPNCVVSTGSGDFIVAGWKPTGQQPQGTPQRDTCLLRIDRNGEVLWERTYDGGRPLISGSGDRFLITFPDGPTYMIDENGNVVWEKTYTELREIWRNMCDDVPGYAPSIDPYYSLKPIGGEVVADTGDDGFILIRGSNLGMAECGENILWRIDGEGRTIWATQLTRLTDPANQTSWVLGGMVERYPERILRGKNGSFFLVGNLERLDTHGLIDPYVIKFKDPDLTALYPEQNTELVGEPALLLVISTLILMPLLLLLVPGLLRWARARGT